ncbi:MAG: NAD(P)-dependent dehydrogenase (short-subunit alcohol dehydrogenase family) [Candidatus Azotimanducaceae bacterium]|jgi:NAD(P)-dependent dehydrogenase (short-subunit alcohol dehydrogenase family)
MNIVIVGAAGGIGQALTELIADRNTNDQITATYHQTMPQLQRPNIEWHQVDVTEEADVQWLAAACGKTDWLINAVGLLHTMEEGPEKSIRQTSPAFFLQNMTTNCLPTLLLAKHFQPLLRHSEASVFATVSARVGSIAENEIGGWYSYRSSKAALNMVLKNLSIEWRRTMPRCSVAALHPGTTDTPLSVPFQRNVPADKLFTPAQTAGYLLDVIDQLSPQVSGKFWSWDGEILPW